MTPHQVAIIEKLGDLVLGQVTARDVTYNDDDSKVLIQRYVNR